MKVIFNPEWMAFISYTKKGSRAYKLRPDDSSEEVESMWDFAWEQAMKDDA